ncbi:RNase III domain-containing protein [Durotheca rogersii]|uniref:RNase III domain-containing protein n=1 Tax=Durotheca rogersii TaxID=419775 RepID=UPI00221E5953|nr:RNase III domain-containing protein [Durotheca rogersii]KAI5862956.1 RNase III domain-containing protein [Durotheca rogersii]
MPLMPARPAARLARQGVRACRSRCEPPSRRPAALFFSTSAARRSEENFSTSATPHSRENFSTSTTHHLEADFSTSAAHHSEADFSTSAAHHSEENFSTSAPRRFEAYREVRSRPRWSYTPERMKAPFSPHITHDPTRSIWRVNEDPKKLDAALNSFLGRSGERMLSEDLKWLAVTHKSFDQGRRGFNDRLAFLGRQICILECTQSIITSPPRIQATPGDPFAGRREPYDDPALRSIDSLAAFQPNDVLNYNTLTRIAMETGLTEVVRWKPRMPENLDGSGYDVIMAGAIYGIIGAISLHKGGKYASWIVREKLLKRVQPAW